MSFAPGACAAALTTRHLGRSLEHHASLPSTSAHLKERLARGEVRHGHVAVAEVQTAGYGTQGRAWLSEPGNLFFSLVLGAPVPSLTLAAGVAVAEALQEHTSEVRLKWVNDLVARGCKLGGVLAEARPEGVVLGVGLNLVAAGHMGAIALVELGARPPREALLAAILGRLEPWLEPLAAGEVAEVHARWEASSVTVGAEIVGTHRGTAITGLALGLGATGGLRVRTSTGEVELVTGSIRGVDGRYA